MSTISPPLGVAMNDPEKLRAVARKFEAQAIGEMLKPMFETIDTSKGFGGGGAGEAAFRPMLIEQYAKGMTEAGGIGIAQAMMNQLLRAQEGASASTARTDA